MASTDLQLTLNFENGQYSIDFDGTCVFAISSSSVTEEQINNIYEGMVRSFGLGLQIGVEAHKAGATGCTVKV
ncbi:hypothetical protein [Ferrimonas sp. YFM]|uniref:hypothetical protein n=1 Tax=Ferrimonas sp. YFM TaxID=3028878 RepID=UPI0025724B20|nr:hypothetical protein [Ferrimonas sp. YFM]BDY05972.1 hypothetical protein F0521_30130 [Ferrimonas sp. YFM]